LLFHSSVSNNTLEDTSVTHELAMKILDKVKEGTPYPQRVVDMALMMTGDLDELQQESGEQCRGQGTA
jgi:hypothetical protein